MQQHLSQFGTRKPRNFSAAQPNGSCTALQEAFTCRRGRWIDALPRCVGYPFVCAGKVNEASAAACHARFRKIISAAACYVAHRRGHEGKKERGRTRKRAILRVSPIPQRQTDRERGATRNSLTGGGGGGGGEDDDMI